MHALWLAAGPFVWALHFTVLYGVTALACARGVPTLIPWSIAIATIGATAALLVLVNYARRARDDFIRWTSSALAGLGLLGIAFESVTVLLVPACTT